jgi:hypothetical protein
MKTYTVTDRMGSENIIDANSPEEAAREYAEDGAYGQDERTVWVDVWVTEGEEDDEDEAEIITVTLEPPEPDCAEGEGHDWQQPEWLGGPVGHGGGAIGTDVCARCGAYRHWDSWAQRSDTGEQGLYRVEYSDADDRSSAWIEEDDGDDEIPEGARIIGTY